MEFWSDYITGIWSECDYRFFNDYLAEQFVSHFGNFEPLKYEKSKKDAEHYIFIELKDQFSRRMLNLGGLIIVHTITTTYFVIIIFMIYDL